MYKIYTTLFLSVILLSCYSAKVHYIGSSFEPTRRTDVFVDESSIKKPFTIIGKGYVSTSYERALGRIQKNAIETAKEKGADAILFQDVFIVDESSSISGISRSDSSGRSSLSIRKSVASPVITTKREILFLKYQ